MLSRHCAVRNTLRNNCLVGATSRPYVCIQPSAVAALGTSAAYVRTTRHLLGRGGARAPRGRVHLRRLRGDCPERDIRGVFLGPHRRLLVENAADDADPECRDAVHRGVVFEEKEVCNDREDLVHHAEEGVLRRGQEVAAVEASPTVVVDVFQCLKIDEERAESKVLSAVFVRTK